MKLKTEKKKIIACVCRWPGSIRWDRRRGGGEVSDMSGCSACGGTRHARQLLSRLLPQMPPHVGRGITPSLQNDPNQLQCLLQAEAASAEQKSAGFWVSNVQFSICRCLLPARWTEGLSAMFTAGTGAWAACRSAFWTHLCPFKPLQNLLNKQ